MIKIVSAYEYNDIPKAKPNKVRVVLVVDKKEWPKLKEQLINKK